MIWHNVGYYNNHTDKTNTFQLLLVNRDDVSRGDFDIVFNYDQIQWDTGDTTGNSADPGGVAAHVGYHSLNQCFNYGCGINSAFLALARTRAHSTASIRPAAATGGGRRQVCRLSGVRHVRRLPGLQHEHRLDPQQL